MNLLKILFWNNIKDFIIFYFIIFPQVVLRNYFDLAYSFLLISKLKIYLKSLTELPSQKYDIFIYLLVFPYKALFLFLYFLFLIFLFLPYFFLISIWFGYPLVMSLVFLKG